MTRFISLIIPNRNGAVTIGKCLDAAFFSRYQPFEVIVVDDCSEDNSIEIIQKFPSKLICLKRRSGAARARNVGALHAQGDVLFFTDADCLLQEDTLSVASRTLAEEDPESVIGGTYTRMPHDKRFFSIFQSVFINYSETKNARSPDYIAAHALAIEPRIFRKTSGFAEDFLPILEDVEFSHRLRRAGHKLVLNPELQVQHIFNFSFFTSLRNAFRKSLHWTAYSIQNGDLFADSGTASTELKTNVAAYALVAILLLLALATGQRFPLGLIPWAVAFNVWVNRGLIRAFHRAGGLRFAVAATAYYVTVYPLPVGAGALAGLLRYLLMRTARGRR